MAITLEDLLSDLEAAARLRDERKIDFFVPYAKQVEFFDLGRTKRERLLMAGNQLGKTYAGAAETAYHLTGQYPPDWLGRKFAHPVVAWCAGVTGILVRDGPQFLLCGKPGLAEAVGTGFIPKAALLDHSLARGVTDAFDTIQVEHQTNGVVDGVSSLTFKSYEQGKEKFQSTTVDFLWLDEEPPEDVYSECTARITATDGMIFITFTPLKGMSKVVARYLQDKSPGRAVVHMTVYDAPHMTPKMIASSMEGYPVWQHKTRLMGMPMMGEGLVFALPQESVMEEGITWVPAHWPKLWGVDFGIDHPFAAVLIAWDRDNDVIHVLHCIRMKDAVPLMHAVPMKVTARMVPVAWPHDGNARDKGSGEALSKLYKAQGLLMLPEHSKFPDGSISTEAGIMEMDERMKTGRLKVAKHLSEWFEEFNMYHRKDGQIVKVNDDLLSATRIAVMAKRFSRIAALGPKVKNGRQQTVANDIDFDLS